MQDIKQSDKIEKVFETPQDEYSKWFGYYNYDPLSTDHSKLLCNRITKDGMPETAEISVEIGYYDIPSGQWHHVGFSDSWNWQQGCMAQWLSDEEIIYNTSDNNCHIAIIHNLSNGKNRKINWAIYSILPDSSKSITLDMERAHWCRAYHYESVADKRKDGPVFSEDGVFEVDLLNNTRKRIVSIQEVIGMGNGMEVNHAKHWLEHVMVSPNGKRFCFLHRYSPIDNVYEYKTRLFIANIDGTNLQLVDSGYSELTHFGWISDDEFAVYTYDPYRFRAPGLHQLMAKHSINIIKYAISFVNTISHKLPYPFGKWLSGRRTYYQLYRINNNAITKDKRLESFNFAVDGHPSFSKNGQFMYTDSYPWKDGKQRLMLYDMKNSKTTILAELPAYYHGTPASCDLHPKLSRDNHYITIDTAYDMQHHMIVYKIKES